MNFVIGESGFIRQGRANTREPLLHAAADALWCYVVQRERRMGAVA